jgi:HK97 family phage prohead protease
MIEDKIEDVESLVRALPDNYRPAVSEDVPEGRACGNCVHYNEDMVNDDGVQVWCDLWADWVRGDYYCNRWEGSARYGKDDDDERSADMGNNESDVIMEDEEFRFEAPRENLVRQVDFRAKQSTDGLTLEGYAAVFNEWTEIDSYEGTFQERIAPGAFKRTIGMRTPVLQFDHGTHPLIGSIPLGRITNISEDSHGLRIKARLSDNWLVEPVRDAIRDGAIQGMSFRFRVVDEKWARGKNGAERTITEIELLEAGPVVFPAYEQTSVGVRSREIISGLENPEIRSEIAKILAMGTDITSLALTDDPVENHSSVSDASADSHAKVRSKTQRQAIARLTLEKDNHED